jgi:UDP-2,4-diacetamido-2,4,6-trideoxy-beta-L-altropyranose hydrolase
LSIVVHSSTGDNIGLGHLKRCLSIAEELRKLSYQVEFIIDNYRYSDLVHGSGFEIKKTLDTGQKYDMIIIDKYYINENFLTSYKKQCKILARIDDSSPMIIDRVSDVIINGNPYASLKTYDRFVRKDCRLIIGRDFIPMDRKFCRIREIYRIRKSINNIAITFGASDNSMNYAYKVSKKIMMSDLQANILVLNGEKLKDKLDHVNVKRLKLLPLIDNIDEVFMKTDIVVCSSSTTCWQLAAIGIPFIAFKTADNQSLAFEYIKRTKIGIALENDAISNGELEREIKGLDKYKRQSLSKNSRKNIDCKGSERIANELIKIAF